jgi:hypothetical protein
MRPVENEVILVNHYNSNKISPKENFKNIVKRINGKTICLI